MLSRVANSLYWLGRYLERAENLARLVEVNRYDALDTVGAASINSDQIWQPLLYATCSEDAYRTISESSPDAPDVASFITFSREHPDSIRQCIASARENARMVRDQISEDMWLELNSFHLFIQSREAEQLWDSQPDAFFRRTIRSCLLFSGLINATILHDEGWHFIQTGKFLERADKTTRILDMLAYHADPEPARLASALRSCSGLSAFREEGRGDISLDTVTAFLLFSQSFPRSVRFCLRTLDEQLHNISGTPGGAFSNEAERLAGSLLAQLNFSSMDNVWQQGLNDYIDGLQQQFNHIGQRIFETYVLLPAEIRSVNRDNAPVWQQQQQQQ
ncbi:MAG: alpha-E domain-containing protein [Puniceicoccaceae bacterium]